LSKILTPLLFAVLAAACSGSQGPPPPVATPTPAGTSSDLQPTSSREAPASATTSAPGVSTGEAAPSLPPGHPPIGGMGMSGAPAAAAHSAGTIEGRIALAPALRTSLAASDVLYVIAKKGKTTLAVRRIEKPSFPLDFELSGADVMVSGSSFEGPVDLVVRLSRTGDAIPSKGDLEGTARNVKIPARGVSVTIDRVRD
jgi:hypothetical protein